MKVMYCLLFILVNLKYPSVSVESCIYLGKGNLSKGSSGLEIIENNRSANTITGNNNTDHSSAISIFAIDYNKLRFSTQEALSDMGQWQGLRKVTANLSAIDASIFSVS